MTSLLSRKNKARPWLALAASLTLLPLYSSSVWGADAPATQSRRSDPSLETLGDDRLMTELASRGLDDLLNRYFDANNVPQAKRQSIRALGALADLTNPASKLTGAQKQQRVQEAAASVDVVLSGITDPQKLMEFAGALIENGVNRDVNTLEYWGESSATRQRLKPVATAVYKLLGQASTLADDEANKIASTLKGNDDKRADLWVKLDAMARNAKYQQNMAAYFVVLATDPNDPARKTMAEQAIKYLSEFDNADSNVQARVRNMIGKLTLAKGSYKEARRSFATVANDKGEIKPPPNAFEQYEARYFTAVADVLGKDAATANQDLASLQTWQKQTMPKLLAGLKLDPKVIDETGKGVDAAAQMLRYRIDVLDSELTQNPDQKKKADAAAEQVLLQLRKDRPELAPIIDEQLVARMPLDRPVNQLNALMLQGLMTRGMTEYKKSDAQKPDPKVMQHALDAAREILARQGKDKDLTPQAVAEASIVIPTLRDRLGHPLEAIQGYLDYAVKFFAANTKLATQAMDRAGFLVFQLKKQQPTPPGFTELYGRFLETAVNKPFEHKELIYLLGEHLQAIGKPKEALPWYQAVPTDNPSYLNAQYKSMLCLRDLLDGKTTPQEHKQYVDELVKAAGIVKQLGAASKNEFDRAKAVQSTLVYARLARTEQHDPKSALQTLSDFDTLVKGLPGEKQLQNEALFERVQCDMAMGQFNQATATLVNLLDKTEGSEGMGLVRQLLDELDKEYVKADVDHDVNTMRVVARNEAQLTGFLGQWAKENKDPNIRKFYYAYVVYDARTKRLAGTLAQDPAEKKKLLQQTLTLYQDLQSPAMHELYVKTLDPKKIADGDIDPKAPDPSVQTGLALTEFELGDYAGAQALLGDLLGSQKLGPPVAMEMTSDGPKTKVNDLYWECTYKLLKCNVELAKASNDKQHQDMMANTQRGLKNVLIRGGIPDRWEDEFESLRKEIIPDFTVGAATQPAKPQGAGQRVSQK